MPDKAWEIIGKACTREGFLTVCLALMLGYIVFAFTQTFAVIPAKLDAIIVKLDQCGITNRVAYKK